LQVLSAIEEVGLADDPSASPAQPGAPPPAADTPKR